MDKQETIPEKMAKAHVRKIRRKILETGFIPSWELFTNTFAYYQINNKYDQATMEMMEKAWRKEDEKCPIVQKEKENAGK